MRSPAIYIEGLDSDFILPRFNTVKYGKHSLKYLGPFLWSRLTKEEHGKNSLSAFKRCIKKRDLTNLISDGDVKTITYAIVELITCAINIQKLMQSFL